jgi:hypothetical protein
MGNFLRIVNGVPRSFAESSSIPIYDQRIEIVANSPTGNQLVGPISAGTAITLPLGQTYVAAELEVDFRGQLVKPVYDYNYVGGSPHTQISFTFDLLVGDSIDLRVARAP